MFETQEFKRALEETAQKAVRERYLLKYDPFVIDVLLFLATANEEHLMLVESRNLPSLRRGRSTALESAKLLLTEAASRSRTSGRSELTVEDFRVAYQANYCKVWPFCR